MKTLVVLCALILCGNSLLAQKTGTEEPQKGVYVAGSGGRPLPACEDEQDIAHQAFVIEGELTEMDSMAMNIQPIATVRSLAPKAKTLADRLALCALRGHDEEIGDLLMAEARALDFIVQAQLENAGQAAGGAPLLTTDPKTGRPLIPVELSAVAPSCKTVNADKFVPELEGFLSEHQDSSTLEWDEVWPYVQKAGDNLLQCAYQAKKAGFKDAAFRILSDESALDTALSVARDNDQAPIIQVIQSVSPGASVPVEVGPNHCTATIQNWGFQKTIDWNCY